VTHLVTSQVGMSLDSSHMGIVGLQWLITLTPSGIKGDLLIGP